MKRSPSGTAETTSDKYTKASAKHRYSEVAKHTVSLGSHLPCLHANLSLYFHGSTTLILYHIYSLYM